MTRFTLILLFVLAPLAVLAQDTSMQDAGPSDFEQIEKVIGHYFQGHATGDGSHFARAFHPDALMFSAGPDGEMRRFELRGWFDGRNDPAPDEDQRHRWIESIEVLGTVATARLVLDYPGVVLHDVMTLVKAEGKWQIVSKVFSASPKGK